MVFRLAGLASALLLTPAAFAQSPKPFSCAVRATMTRDKNTVSMASKIYYAAPTKVRVEQSNGKQSSLMIVNGADVWLINTSKKEGQHRKLSAAEQAPLTRQARSPGDIVNEFIKGGGKKAGQESISGARCDVYKRPAKNGVSATMWVLSGPEKLVRRVLIAGTVKAATAPGQPMKSFTYRQQQDFSDWQVGKPLPETLFRPAAGLKITEFTPPPGGMPMVPGAPGPGRR